MLDQLPRPTIFAHRGASLRAPENTLAAFELARQEGADALELDVQLSRDGQVVVIHDTTVDRTTDGAGRVADLSLAELQALDAGSSYGEEFAGLRLPTLEEVLAWDTDVFINIELKNYAAPMNDLPARTAAAVLRQGAAGRVLFSSFNPLALLKVRRVLPETPVGLLAIKGAAGAWARSWPAKLFRPQAIHPHYNDASAALVRRTGRAGWRLYPYTANQPEELRRLYRLGVDGVFTDDPALARRIREEIAAGEK
jgi:glycerophosphoryl diester phosphodiesterase